MARLPLSLACWDYDRTRALADGSVPIDGIDLTYLNLPVEETFFRMLRHREFDVSEMSLSSYTLSLFRDDPPFIAIPVFPSRYFRHSCIYVNEASGVREPKDLAGKRVGNPEYQMTAPVWIRGILQDEYGVDPSSPSYFTGGEEEPGREEKIKLDLPEKFRLADIGPEKTLSLSTNASGPNEKRTLAHLLKLEETGVKPDDLVTWHVWADDIGPDGQVRRTALEVGPGKLQAYYDAHQADFVRKESVNLRQITITQGAAETPAEGKAQIGRAHV